jgi:hypothetical protein
MADYRILVPRFWTDERVRRMHPKYKLVFNFSITGLPCCSFTEIGIYEVNRSDIRNAIETLDGVNPMSEEDAFDIMGWTDEEIRRKVGKKPGEPLTKEEEDRKLGFFNREKPELLVYNPTTHMIHVKSLFKYLVQFGWLKTPQSIADAVRKDFKRWGDKCPEYFAQFSRENRKILTKTLMQLNPENKNYASCKKVFEKLFELEKEYPEKPSQNVKLPSAEEVKKILSRSGIEI